MNLFFQENEILCFLCYKDNLNIINIYLVMAIYLAGIMFPHFIFMFHNFYS